jgi:hypothetical protein
MPEVQLPQIAFYHRRMKLFLSNLVLNLLWIHMEGNCKKTSRQN